MLAQEPSKFAQGIGGNASSGDHLDEQRVGVDGWTSKRRNLHPWPVFVSGGSKEHRACLGVGVHVQHILASTGGLGGQVVGDGGLADPRLWWWLRLAPASMSLLVFHRRVLMPP